MNNAFKNKGNIAVWVTLAVVATALVSYLFLYRSGKVMNQQTTPAPVTVTGSQTATGTPSSVQPAAAQPKQSPATSPSAKAKPDAVVPAPSVPTKPTATNNWYGTWNSLLTIVSPSHCAAGPGRLTAYMEVNNNAISGKMYADGLGSNLNESKMQGTVDGDKFTIYANGIEAGLTITGTISGDVLNVKTMTTDDCESALITDKPFQFFRLNYSGNWQGSLNNDASSYSCFGSGKWNSNLNFAGGKVSGDFSVADTMTSGAVSGTLTGDHLQFTVGNPGQAPIMTVDGTISTNLSFVGSFNGTQKCNAGSSLMSGLITGAKK